MNNRRSSETRDTKRQIHDDAACREDIEGEMRIRRRRERALEASVDKNRKCATGIGRRFWGFRGKDRRRGKRIRVRKKQKSASHHFKVHPAAPNDGMGHGS